LSDRDTYALKWPGWICFHCGEHFRRDQVQQAREHFGATPDYTPGCLEKLTAGERGLVGQVRALEAELARYREEDTDLHREIRSLETDHALALRREEEKGYARAVRDLQDPAALAELGLVRAQLPACPGCVGCPHD
jgi:hypothetical protein